MIGATNFDRTHLCTFRKILVSNRCQVKYEICHRHVLGSTHSLCVSSLHVVCGRAWSSPAVLRPVKTETLLLFFLLGNELFNSWKLTLSRLSRLNLTCRGPRPTQAVFPQPRGLSDWATSPESCERTALIWTKALQQSLVPLCFFWPLFLWQGNLCSCCSHAITCEVCQDVQRWSIWVGLWETH